MTDTDSQTEALYRRLLMAQRCLMGVRMGEAARATVLASLPTELSPAERRVALLRRYYANDFSRDELQRIEAAVREEPARPRGDDATNATFG